MRWIGRVVVLALLPGLAAVMCYFAPPLPRATIAAGENAQLEVLSARGDLLVTSERVIEPRGFGSGPVPRIGRLCAWDTYSGQLRFVWCDLSEVTYCPGGCLFAATDKDRHRRVWDLATGEEKADLEL